MAQKRKPTLELGARVAGIRAKDDWNGGRRPAYASPRDTVVGEVRTVFADAPDVVKVFTDSGDLVTIRDPERTA